MAHFLLLPVVNSCWSLRLIDLQLPSSPTSNLQMWLMKGCDQYPEDSEAHHCAMIYQLAYRHWYSHADCRSACWRQTRWQCVLKLMPSLLASCVPTQDVCIAGQDLVAVKAIVRMKWFNKQVALSLSCKTSKQTRKSCSGTYVQ